jgi:hypothetical protein
MAGGVCADADWAKDSHQVFVVAADGERLSPPRILNTARTSAT